MATASEATCAHNRTLCAGCARADLRLLGRTPIGRSAGEGKLPGVCPACQAHSLSELIAFIEATVAPRQLRLRTGAAAATATIGGISARSRG